MKAQPVSASPMPLQDIGQRDHPPPAHAVEQRPEHEGARAHCPARRERCTAPPGVRHLVEAGQHQRIGEEDGVVDEGLRRPSSPAPPGCASGSGAAARRRPGAALGMPGPCACEAPGPVQARRAHAPLPPRSLRRCARLPPSCHASAASAGSPARSAAPARWPAPARRRHEAGAPAQHRAQHARVEHTRLSPAPAPRLSRSCH